MNQDTVTISRAEYEELRKANNELRQANEDLSKQVSFLMQQIALVRQQRFGSSSEKSKYDDGSEQLSFLFNEIEVYADSSSVLKEPDLTTVKEHKRNRKHLTRETDLPEDIETEVVNRDVPESERTCSVCGEQMEWIGEDVIRRLKIVPAKYVVVVLVIPQASLLSGVETTAMGNPDGWGSWKSRAVSAEKKSSAVALWN